MDTIIENRYFWLALNALCNFTGVTLGFCAWYYLVSKNYFKNQNPELIKQLNTLILKGQKILQVISTELPLVIFTAIAFILIFRDCLHPWWENSAPTSLFDLIVRVFAIPFYIFALGFIILTLRVCIYVSIGIINDIKTSIKR